MGALANAVQLLRDDTLRLYATAAAATVARSVLAEPDTDPGAAERKWLAHQVLVNPRFQTDMFITGIATDPTLTVKGSTVGDGADITEADILASVAEVWTAVAILAKPTQPPVQGWGT